MTALGEGRPRRVFLAVYPPVPILDALDRVRERLAPALSTLRWTRRENLHFTLRFLGDRDADAIRTAGEAASRVAAGVRPFRLELCSLGTFPEGKRPRVLWAGTGRGGARLVALARELDRAFDAAGLGRAQKALVPHLTLGRWRTPRVAAAAPWNEVGSIGGFTVRSLALLESTLGSGPPVYGLLERIPLAGERPA